MMNVRTPPVIARNIAWSYASWTISLALPLLTVPLCLHFLGQKSYGDWIVILSITSYLGLANLGLGQTVANRMAELVATGRDSELSELVSTAFFSYAALAAVMLACLMFFTPRLAPRLDLRDGSAVLLAFVAYVAMNFAAFPLGVNSMLVQGFQRVDWDRAVDAAISVIRVLLIALGFVAGLRLVGLAVINGAAVLAAPLIAFFLARRLTVFARPALSRFSPRLLREMLAPSAAFLGIQLGGFLIMGNTDNLVIGYAMGSAAVTRYAVPFRLIMIASGAFWVVFEALMPTITATYARSESDRLNRGFIFATRIGLVYGTLATVGLWIVGPSFIRLWAGPGVFPGRLTFGLQLFLLIGGTWVSAASAMLWATTRHYGWSVLTIFEGLLNLGLSLWWVRIWGLPGVIGATVAASVLTNFWYLPYKAIRTLQIPIGLAARELGPTMAMSAIAIVATIAFWRPVSPSWPEVLSAAAIGEAILLLAFGTIGFSNDERRLAALWFSQRVRLLRAA